MMPLLCGYSLDKYIQLVIGISCFGWFTYYYIGYLLGNGLLTVIVSNKVLLRMWVLSIFLQIFEGYWLFSLGNSNCGTQLKLSAILSGTLFIILSFKYIISDKYYYVITLEKLGNISFGVYFSHIAVMSVLHVFPWYVDFARYPMNAIIVLLVSSLFVAAGKKCLGGYAKYIAF